MHGKEAGYLLAFQLTFFVPIGDKISLLERCNNQIRKPPEVLFIDAIIEQKGEQRIY